MAHTDCSSHLISIGEAAKLTGKKYQLIRGVAVRSATSKKPKVHGRRTLIGGSWHWQVCSECIVEFYGKAGSEAGELFASPLQGYRQWMITWDNMLQAARYSNTVWKPGENKATCVNGHPAPQKKCTCGFYALAQPEGTWYTDTSLVLGAIEIWGRAVPGFDRYTNQDQGWRCEYAKPTVLYCGTWEQADKVHAAATVYGIPVTHSMRLLRETDWGEEVNTLGYWQGGRDGVRDPAEDASGASSRTGIDPRTGRAACRVAAAGAGTVAELRFLFQEGIISAGNVAEVVTGITEIEL